MCEPRLYRTSINYNYVVHKEDVEVSSITYFYHSLTSKTLDFFR